MSCIGSISGVVVLVVKEVMTWMCLVQWGMVVPLDELMKGLVQERRAEQLLKISNEVTNISSTLLKKSV